MPFYDNSRIILENGVVSRFYGIWYSEDVALKISFTEEERFVETSAIYEHKLVLYNIVLLDLNWNYVITQIMVMNSNTTIIYI